MAAPTTTLADLKLILPNMPSAADTLSVDSSTLPFVIWADTNTSEVELSTDTTRVTAKFPKTVTDGNGTSYHEFSGNLNLTYQPDDFQVLMVGRNYSPNTTWQANSTYLSDERILDSTGTVWKASTTGVSGKVEPTWTDDTVVDNYQIVWEKVGEQQVSTSQKFNLIYYVSENAVTIAPPTGVSSYKAQDVCRLEWVQPSVQGAVGVRVMISTDASGVATPYTQYGDIVPVDAVSRTAEVAVSSTPTVTTLNGTRTTTIVEQVQTVTFCGLDIPKVTVNGVPQFYALLSTIVYDSGSNSLFESQQAGPITCGYVDLKSVTPTDFIALQRKEDIAKRLITQMTKFYPDLDLTPRSELRDLLIDPVSLELANMSVREWFSRVSQSVSAMSQLDDADGDGFSDPFDNSTLKQQIARAYGLNGSDTQALIDKQFDIIGEGVGTSRGGATSAVTTLTFYTYVRPTQTVAFNQGTQVATIADASTASVTFSTTASATLDAASADSFYDAVNGWWAVNVPAQATATGSMTNVGANTIRTAVTGVPSGWNVTNQVGAEFGADEEINSKFAARIRNRQLVGIDSGTRGGYLSTALKTPGIVGAKVVAAGDVEMLRDWDETRKKHVYGCVDIYTRGTSYSQQTDAVAFRYANSGTLSATPMSKSPLKFSISRPSSEPNYPFYAAVELVTTDASGNQIFFNLDKAQFTSDGGLVLDENDYPYQWTGDEISKAKQFVYFAPAPDKPKVKVTNSTVFNYLPSMAKYALKVRYLSPLTCVPVYQPLIKVSSVIGESWTGIVSPDITSLVHTSDFLLFGGSNRANDKVVVNTANSVSTTATVVASATEAVNIDSAMDIRIDNSGAPGDVISVLNEDKSIRYTYGLDYIIVPTGPYHQYGLKLKATTTEITALEVTSNGTLILTTNNKFGVGSQLTISGIPNPELVYLNGASFVVNDATSTYVKGMCPVSPGNAVPPTPVSGTLSGTSIQEGDKVTVTYKKFAVNERLSKITEPISITTEGVILTRRGVVDNVTLPLTYGEDDLATDADLIAAHVPFSLRYVKVVRTATGEVMRQGTDYTLVIDAQSGQAAIARILSGHLDENTEVTVTYYVTECFDVATQYPTYVELLAQQIATTKHAAADVLVKAMLPSPVDITMTVRLSPDAAADTLDSRIRTVIGQVLDNSDETLYQSEVVRQVKAVTGVQSVQLPLARCAKSDGAYDVGIVIPTQTAWTGLTQDSTFRLVSPNGNMFISPVVLPDNTKPSGGDLNAFVGLLHEGEAYTRAMTANEFISKGSTGKWFYIVGQNDTLNVPVLDANGKPVYGTDGLPQTTAKALDGYAKRVLISVPTSPSVVSPSGNSYLVTYQVFNESGASDIQTSSTEYLVPGKITINYITEEQ